MSHTSACIQLTVSLLFLSRIRLSTLFLPSKYSSISSALPPPPAPWLGAAYIQSSRSDRCLSNYQCYWLLDMIGKVWTYLCPDSSCSRWSSWSWRSSMSSFFICSILCCSSACLRSSFHTRSWFFKVAGCQLFFKFKSTRHVSDRLDSTLFYIEIPPPPMIDGCKSDKRKGRNAN